MRVAGFECTRNAYEKNVTGKDMIVQKGFTAEFDAEFFSSPTGGYPLVENETNIFQALLPMKPSAGDTKSSEENTSVDHFSLTVSVHDAPSFPLGSALSALTGKNVSLYHYRSVSRQSTDVRWVRLVGFPSKNQPPRRNRPSNRKSKRSSIWLIFAISRCLKQLVFNNLRTGQVYHQSL